MNTRASNGNKEKHLGKRVVTDLMSMPELLREKVYIVLEQYKDLIPTDKSLQIGSYRFATIPKDNLTAVW